MRSLHQQKGDFLIEAMIGTLITALVSLGTLAITSRVMLTQEEMSRQETIVTLVREQLYGRNSYDAAKDLCKNDQTRTDATEKFSKLDRGNVTYKVECPDTLKETYSLNGKALPAVTLPIVYVTVEVPAHKKSSTKYTYALGVKK